MKISLILITALFFAAVALYSGLPEEGPRPAPVPEAGTAMQENYGEDMDVKKLEVSHQINALKREYLRLQREVRALELAQMRLQHAMQAQPNGFPFRSFSSAPEESPAGVTVYLEAANPASHY
jgi:hypothetical protein